MGKWLCKFLKKIKIKCKSSCCKSKCEIDIDNTEIPKDIY